MSVLVGAVVGPQRSNFEQVSSGGHQMSIARDEGVHVRLGAGWGWGPVQWGTMHHGQWSMPPILLTDRHEWKHYIPATSLAGDKMFLKCVWLYIAKSSVRCVQHRRTHVHHTSKFDYFKRVRGQLQILFELEKILNQNNSPASLISWKYKTRKEWNSDSS